VNVSVSDNGSTDRKAEGLVRLLRHVADVFQIDIRVILWNGAVVPLCSHPTSDLALKIYDPGVITSLLRAPKLWTAIELLLNGRIRIVNGLFFAFEPRRQDVENKIRAGLWRRISKREAFRALSPFFFGDRHPPIPRMDFSGVIKDRAEQGRDDKTLVQFHYDLSNDFYALFLDPRMVYSCAYFPTWDASLEEAQVSKLDIVCRKLQLQPGERFLDIGCGWGGLVIHAAQRYGVQAHGVTLSQAQFDFACARIAELGLADRIKIELKDYRALTGEYDKIASVGMFEHVGLDNHDAYFEKMSSLLRVRGMLLNHAITRRARRKDFRYKPPVYEAMTRYIFPGGELDHIGLSLDNLEIHEFDVHDVEGLRDHYAKTCRIWAERLHARRHEAEAMIGEAKTHLWLIYLARCAIGFERGAMSIFQTLASKRDSKVSGLPPTRRHLLETRPQG
jgi:cyclopropane-fatty-acyl-phospholipid synthase